MKEDIKELQKQLKMYMEENEIQKEVIKYSAESMDDYEQQISLLKKTIVKQKEDIKKLFKENHDLKLKIKKKEMEYMESFPLGYNPFQE